MKQQMLVLSEVVKLARLTPEKFYQHTQPELLKEQGDCVVREIIKRDTRQMALEIAKWEYEKTGFASNSNEVYKNN